VSGDRHDLELVLRSDFPIVVVETTSERRFLELLTGIAISRSKSEYRPLFRWSVTDGLQRLDLELEPQRHVADPGDVLRHIRSVDKPGIYALLDFHPYLQDPVSTRLLKDIAMADRSRRPTVVLISHRIELPEELRRLAARFEMRLPDADQLRQIIVRIAREYRETTPDAALKIDAKALEMLIQNLSGLDHDDAERLARAAIVDDGALTRSDLPEVMQAKYELLNQSGILSFEYETVLPEEVAGLDNIKQWLRQRAPAFGPTRPEGLDPPKGLLLLGVQGCGKSLGAKAAASVLGVPLLRLDFGALYNKYHGETERNLREALGTASVLSPCVLWLDEIEKGIAADDSDSGTSRRVLGSFLTWMAERESPVFIVATANEISALPPELIRKGRFDEIFFVDLPPAGQRNTIFRIHLRKRSADAGQFDLDALAAASDGFSGAEIEQAVVSALYSAHAQAAPLTMAHLLAELRRTRPLSIVMAERIAELRAWARSRTVPAD